MSSSPTPKRPVGWTAPMTHFVQTQVPEGEETDSVIILVEAEYTSMDGKVGSDRIKSLMTSVSHFTVFAAFRRTRAHQDTSQTSKALGQSRDRLSLYASVLQSGDYV